MSDNAAINVLGPQGDQGGQGSQGDQGDQGASGGAASFTNGVTVLTNASGTQNIAHGLGVVPKKIRITTITNTTGSLASQSTSCGVYNGTTTAQVYVITVGSSGWDPSVGTSSSNIITANDGMNNGNTLNATVTFDSTNIILSTTKGSSGCDTRIMWEAEA